MSEIKPAKYSKSTKSDYKSISIFEGILDINSVVPHLSKNDKTPNYDGFLEILENDGSPIGKLEVQVKTLKKAYTKPSYSVKIRLLAHIRNTQLPFLLVAVDQDEKKAFWAEITHDKAIELINEALNKKRKSISFEFDANNEIPKNSSYAQWSTIVSEHKKMIFNSKQLNEQLIATKEELKKLQLKESEVDRSSDYTPIHVFLDALNNLFSFEFKVIKKIFISDFWKLGIVTFSEITHNEIAYSLFPIGWNENLKQIDRYRTSNNFLEFANSYPSVRAYGGRNPIFENPEKHAYERVRDYLKILLEKKWLWPSNQYMQQEFLFYIKDTQFRDSTIAETDTLDLILFKERIEKFLQLIPEPSKVLMKQFPEGNNNLYRALDYIQNFRIGGKNILSRFPSSKDDLQNIAISVGETGKFPSKMTTVLDNYYTLLWDCYEDVLNEFFPQLKNELSNYKHFNTMVIIPTIRVTTFNNRTFNTTFLDIIKLNKSGRKERAVFVEKNESNLRRGSGFTTIIYKDQEYSQYGLEGLYFSELIDDLPLRKGVYSLLAQNLEEYFKRFLKNS